MMSSGYGGLARLLKGLIASIFIGGAAHGEPVTILALGDSLTAGYGLSQGEGFVPQLEAWLAAKGVDAHVINAGVSGDTSAGGASRLDWILTDDVDAALVALGGNDMLRGIAPDETKSNLDQILTTLADRDVPALLIGIPGPANFGPAYKTAFDETFTTLSHDHAAPLYPNFFGGLGDQGTLVEATRKYLQPDGLHPNREGVSRIVEAMGPAVLELIQ